MDEYSTGLAIRSDDGQNRSLLARCFVKSSIFQGLRADTACASARSVTPLPLSMPAAYFYTDNLQQNSPLLPASQNLRALMIAPIDSIVDRLECRGEEVSLI